MTFQNEITCANCGTDFSSTNEDDLVSKICPECQDGQTGHHQEYDWPDW